MTAIDRSAEESAQLVGVAAGKFALEQLVGEGKAQGKIVEIRGGLGITATFERSDGFHAALRGRRVLDSCLISNQLIGSRIKHTTSCLQLCFIFHDLRFPTSDSLHGSDAINSDPDYSADYVLLKTDRDHGGHGLTFTIGRGQGATHKTLIIGRRL